MTSGQGEAAGMTRRGVLRGAAAVGVGTVAAGALAACSGGDGGAPAGREPAGSATEPVNVPAADVPVGSAAISGQVVVSQPTAGQFKAFSAVCTHEACLITRVQGATLECTCHGSTFSTTDGSVVRGPAQRALDPRTVSVAGDTITVT
jgi:Rieske Fe-S protein